jgi:hypothetical protein
MWHLCLDEAEGVSKRTALAERKGIGKNASKNEAVGGPVLNPTLCAILRNQKT